MSRFFVFFLLLLSLPVFVSAQSGEVALPGDGDAIRAVITGPKEVQVGKTIVLDASLSIADEETVSYLWLREGDRISTSAETLLTLDEAGIYEITLIVQDRRGGELRRSEAVQHVQAYQRKVVLVAGPGMSQEKLDVYRQSGEEVGTYVNVLHTEDLAIPLGLEDAMTSLISDNINTLLGADVIVLWSLDGAGALNALSRAIQGNQNLLSLMSSQTIVIVTEGNMGALGRVVRGPFSVLQPSSIVITRKEAIHPLIEADTVATFLQEIEKRGYDFLIVDQAISAVRPWNLLSSLVNYMVTKGVNSRMIILLLMLPVILTIITFLKQVIGVTTFGLYAPAVIALSLVALGWQIGLALLAIIIFAGYLTRAVISRYRLLYIPKIAIILSVISLVLLIVLAVGASFNILLAPDTIFILLIMTTLSEEFMSVKAEEGLRSAIMSVSETVLVSLICFAIVQWEVLKSLILAYPELIILTLVANYLLGRWTGLRVSEMIRFREVFKYIEE